MYEENKEIKNITEIEKEKNLSYGYIPDYVAYDCRLSDREKLVYVSIRKLANKNGYCYAKNSTLAKLHNCSTKTIQNSISKLVELGFLDKKIKYWDGKDGIEKRYLIPIIPIEKNLPMETNYMGVWKENSPTYGNELHAPMEKNCSDNSISKNNKLKGINEKDNPYPETGHETDDEQFFNNFDAICEGIKKAWNSLISPVPKIKTVTASNKNDIKTILESNSIDDILSAIMEIDNSDFLGGYKTDFKANFNWFLKYDNFIKVLDGDYKDINNPWNTDNRINNNYYYKKDEVDENFSESLKEWENGGNRWA